MRKCAFLKCAFFWVVCATLAFQMVPLTDAQADLVGRLTRVEGRVDILKGGQLPANPVKVDDGVQIGDVLRTKSMSKTLITFIDNSTLTIAPESRVGIEAYMFDPAQNKRNAVVELFQGLAHVVVAKVFKAIEPDFVVKTKTAVTGVRGTDFGVRIRPNSADILNFEGVLQVGNIFPEVSQLFRRAFKVAYSFGPGPGGPHHWVFLKGMQGTTVVQGLPPTVPYTLTNEDRQLFMRQLEVNAAGQRGGGVAGTPFTAEVNAAVGMSPVSVLNTGIYSPPGVAGTTAGMTPAFVLTTGIYTPPKVLPTPTTPPPPPPAPPGPSGPAHPPR